MKRKIIFKLIGIVFSMAAILLPLFIFSSKSVVAKADTINSLRSSKDTYSDAQWYINNPGYYMNYSLGTGLKQPSVKGIDMNVTKAWDKMKSDGTADSEVVVAVIDTGVDYNHPDLKENIWINKGDIKGDHIDNDNNGYVDDYYGWDFYNNDASVCHYKKGTTKASADDSDNHGTHVAGIIAAVAGNNRGIAGIASNINVKIMILKINGGQNEEGKMSDAIKAIKYATMMGADICNISWGTTEYSKELYEAMKESDMLFVAAAGNDGDNNDKKPLYPASFKLNNLISVTSVNANGGMPRYSNYGAKSVDLAAPGNDIYSTIVGGYGTMSGSSAAVPQVTAVAALMYAFGDYTYPSDIKNMIVHHIKELPELKGMMRYPGIPDSYQCVTDVEKLSVDSEAPKISFHTIYKQKEMSVPVEVKDAGGSGIRVVKWIYGKKKIEDFMHGVNGSIIIDGTVNFSVAGKYTFYASDYAGNETAVVYEVTADVKPPSLSLSYMVSNDYKTRTVTIKASDNQSGIKRIKYMSGIKKAEDFLPADAGTKLTYNQGTTAFQVTKDGVYTVFVSDNRGNTTVQTITVKTVKSTLVQFTELLKTLTIGDKFKLKLRVAPKDTTDTFIFSSDNTKVAKVSASGEVTALSEGSTFIMVQSSSGKVAVCFIIVNSDA